MKTLTRRKFIGSVAAGAAFAISGTKSSGRVIGANDTIRVAVAGLNGRGNSHIGAYLGMKDVEIACLIDPDTRTFAQRVAAVEKKKGYRPKTIQDFRVALDDKEIDAISIATPNHWHAPMTIWACQAGKDVYVEKPCSHNVREGRIAVEVARKYGRIVQHGTQGRAGELGARIASYARSGKLGKLQVSRGLCYKKRPSIGFKQPIPPPAEVDFDLWLGPAPETPFHENLVHYNWHWFWETGNGDIGNQGVHQMDAARWAIPEATLPRSVISLGGRFGYEDQGQTPNTQISIFDFGDTQLIFEVRGLVGAKFLGQDVGNTFHFEKGTMAGGKFIPKGEGDSVELPDVEIPPRIGDGIFGNFIAAMRTRKHTDLAADILEAHYSSALCHLANVSYRLGTVVPFNPKTKAFGDNTEAYETFARMEEHLGGNGLNLAEAKYRLGRKLIIDTATETIQDDPEANALLTRNYRAPFHIPSKVEV